MNSNPNLFLGLGDNVDFFKKLLLYYFPFTLWGSEFFFFQFCDVTEVAIIHKMI
jgi:hypothetical protein